MPSHLPEDQQIKDIEPNGSIAQFTEENTRTNEYFQNGNECKVRYQYGRKENLSEIKVRKLDKELDEGFLSLEHGEFGVGRLGDTTRLLPRQAEVPVSKERNVPTPIFLRLGSTNTTRLSPRQVSGMHCSANASDNFPQQPLAEPDSDPSDPEAASATVSRPVRP